jgi:hypothetical protein
MSTVQRSLSRIICSWLAYRNTPFGARVKRREKVSRALRASFEGGLPGGGATRRPMMRIEDF